MTTMLPPEELIGRYLPKTGDLEANTLMFCGTLAVQGGVRREGFEIELEDPTLGKKISHRYAIETLPNEGVGGGPEMGDQLKFGALNNVFGFHLRQAYTPFGQAYREAAAANFELKPSQFTVLALIKHNPGRRQSELAEALNIERSNFVPIIEASESRGLLLREKSRRPAVLFHRGHSKR